MVIVIHIILMLNINNVYKPKLNLLELIFVWFYSSFVCMSAYANVFSTTICEYLRQINIPGPISRVHCGSSVRFGQAVPAYLISAHHLNAFLMYLARYLCDGFQQKKKKRHKHTEREKLSK